MSAPREFFQTAPAKLNLFLHVTGKRDDGYHLLDSLVVFIDGVEDRLSFKAAASFSLDITGPFAKQIENDRNNLVVRAVRAFEKISSIAVHLRLSLEKNIPAGAGLGGGSADTAATIRALEQFYNHPLNTQERDELLLSLGADVPVCYHLQATRMSGIGEQLKAVASPLPAMDLLLVWPNSSCATKDVFRERSGPPTPSGVVIPEAFPDRAALIQYLQTHTSNDLEEAAQRLCPPVNAALQELASLPQARLVRMTGSGSCVFAVFDDSIALENARKKIQDDHPAWWVKTGRLRASDSA